MRQIVRNLYWKVMETRDKFLQTRGKQRFWAKRHLSRREKDNGWIKRYWDTRYSPHRLFLVEKIAKYYPFSNILEIGCNCGPNLFLISKRFPEIHVAGIDINPVAIEIGRQLLSSEGIPNAKLEVGDFTSLGKIQDRSYDICLTDAVLIYVAPDTIRSAIKELIRIARKAVILVEWHTDAEYSDKYSLGVYHFGCWKRNYVSLIKNFTSPDKTVIATKIPKSIWPSQNWEDLGFILEINV